MRLAVCNVRVYHWAALLVLDCCGVSRVLSVYVQFVSYSTKALDFCAFRILEDIAMKLRQVVLGVCIRNGALTFATSRNSVTVDVGGFSEVAGHGSDVGGIRFDFASVLVYGLFSVAVYVFCTC